MVSVLLRHKVNDVPAWKTAFQNAIEMRRSAGERSFRVFHSDSDPSEIVILFEFESKDRAVDYFNSDKLRETMKKAGVAGEPNITYLHQMVITRRTAAD